MNRCYDLGACSSLSNLRRPLRAATSLTRLGLTAVVFCAATGAVMGADGHEELAKQGEARAAVHASADPSAPQDPPYVPGPYGC